MQSLSKKSISLFFHMSYAYILTRRVAFNSVGYKYIMTVLKKMNAYQYQTFQGGNVYFLFRSRCISWLRQRSSPTSAKPRAKAQLFSVGDHSDS